MTERAEDYPYEDFHCPKCGRRSDLDNTCLCEDEDEEQQEDNRR